MKYEYFLKEVKNLPVIESEILLTGQSYPAALKVQLSRWVSSGRLVQLKRGVYVLPEHYRQTQGGALYVANVLKKPSYVSLEKALEFYGLIPEAVKVYTSVTSKRAGTFNNDIGNFEYRHILPDLFWGYQPIVLEGQTVFMARPEKALLDLIYLNSMDVSRDLLDEFRLQNTDVLDLDQLTRDARRFGKAVMVKRAKALVQYILDVTREEKEL